MPVSLHISESPEASWKNVVWPWFEAVAQSALTKTESVAVVTASRTQAYYFRNQLLAAGKSLTGVKFLSVAQLREILLRRHGVRIPLREHLCLLLAATAENLAAEQSSNEEFALVAKSVARDPDHFLHAFDQLGAAGWAFDEIDSTPLRAIAARFEKEARDCGFTFAHQADRAAARGAAKFPPLFSDLLIVGFNSANWPLWHLLQAAVLSSAAATVILDDPRDEARASDETWVGTWEEIFGEAKVVVPIDRAPASSTTQAQFLVGRDTTQQARAVVALSAKFLADPKCERLGILFPGPGALARLVATFLQSAQIAHNDGIAHPMPSAFDDDAWRAWLDLQQAPRLKALFRFLRATRLDIFNGLAIAQVEETLRRAYNQLLIDDLELLSDFCNKDEELRDGKAVAAGLQKIEVLPASALLTEFLSRSRKIFSRLGWKEHSSEIERLSRNWSERFNFMFSRNIFLRWLRDVLGASSLQRDGFGAHQYARLHLLPYSQAEGQPWSHLIFAGLNDETWPSLDDELGFVREEQINELNEQSKTLNRRASKQGRHGEGHWRAREGKTLLLGASERRQIRRRQLQNLVESVTTGIGASANLYSAVQPGRIANPSDFFSWLYFTARHRGVSQQTLQMLEQQTRRWLKDWSPVDAQKVDSISVGRTRYAFDARRQERPAGEYEFSLKAQPDRAVALRVTQWEQSLRWPALVWMEIFLGVEAVDDSPDAWPIATGQWVHRWLAESVHNGEQGAFVDVDCANEIRARIVEHAEHFRQEIEILCDARHKPVPDWWRSGLSNALYIADCLAAKVSGLNDWSEMAVEWSLGTPAEINLGEDEKLRVRGRIDLMLARGKSQTSQLGFDDFWIVDYKTGRQRAFNLRSPRGKETSEQKFHRQLTEGRGVQLALYALAAHALGAKDCQLTLLSPAEQLESQFHLSDVLAQKDFWHEIHRMQEMGVFGMLGPVHRDFGFVRKYPLATVSIDPDLLKTKWALTHPAFSVEAREEAQ